MSSVNRFFSVPRTVPETLNNHSMSTRLRMETRMQHELCEQAMALEMRLASSAGYRTLLACLMRGYASLAADSSLIAAERLLGQAGFLDADIERLARDLGSPRPSSIVQAVQYHTLPSAVGAVYVVAGSRLGAQIISRMVQQRLPGAPVSFFGGARPPGPEWREMKARLDWFGTLFPDTFEAVCCGATQTFEHLGAVLAECTG